MQKKIVQKLKNIDINQINNSTEIDMIWNKIKEAIINSAIEILKMEPKGNNKKWFNDICKNVITEKNELRKRTLHNPSDECIRKYEEQRKLAKKILRRQKRLQKKKKIEEIENEKYNANIFFK